MAVYRKVSISFWTDPKIDENFSPEDKYFFLYLLTNPHTNLCGCYEVSYKQLSNETGYTRDSIIALISRFENTYNLIRYDNKSSEMLILNWKKYNWSSSPKFEKPLYEEIAKVKNPQFREFLLGERYSIDTVSDNKDTVSQSPVTVSVTDTVSVIDITSSNTKKTVRKKNEDTEDFKAFWDAYPKHQNKQAARTAFEKVDVPLHTLLDAIEEQKRSKQWLKDDGEYIPLPSTWLNGKRWEDSMKVDVPKSDGMERYKNLQRLAEEFDDE